MPPASASEVPIPVFIDNAWVRFDADPYVENGITMVPIRAVAEGLGATVSYADRAVSFSRSGKNVKLTIGSNIAIIDGQTVPVSSAPVIRNNRTYVPLRFVSENLGVTVNYEHREVYIWTKPPITQHNGNSMNGNQMAETETQLFWIDKHVIYEQDKASGETRKMQLSIIVDETSTDTHDRVTLIDGSIRANSICIRDGKIYCSSWSQILEIDITSGKTSLLRDFTTHTYDSWQTTNIQLYGNSIYAFSEPPGVSSKLLQVSVSDGGLSLMGKMILSYCVSGGYIYLADVDRYYEGQVTEESTVTITKFTLSGRPIETIYSAKGRFIYNLAAHNGKLYYMVDTPEGTGIERMNLDGSGLEALCKFEYMQTYNFNGGTLYYSIAENSSQSTMGGIYKMDLETRKHTKLLGESTEELTIINGRLYFRGSQGIDSIEL